jgi:hypothetical protein
VSRPWCIAAGALLLLAGCSSTSTTSEQGADPRSAAEAFVERGWTNPSDEVHCCPTGIEASGGRVRVSTTDPAWATVQVRWTDDDGEPFGPDTVVLHRRADGWRALPTLGPDPGCGLPAAVRRELALKGAGTCDPLPPTAGPEAARTTDVDEAGGVRAAITYTSPEELAEDSVVDLRIERHGRRVLRARVRPYGPDLRGTNPTVTHGSKAIDVVDLDADGEPEVVLDLYWGGAHCCTWSEVYRWEPTAKRYDRVRYVWGDNDYDVRDVDGDGRPELVTWDDRFAYAFTSFAGSSFPVQVLHYEAGRMVDVTRHHLDLVRADAAEQQRRYEEVTGTENEDRGALGAWAADECLLDRCDAALAEVHRRTPTSTTTTDFAPEPYATFERHLRTKLTRLGYRRPS